jgi:GNAT superfamily N-acetyltransferase
MLLLATEAEMLERDWLTHVEWGQLLTPADYVEREKRLRDHPWSRETFLSWLFVDERGAVLSSCETYQMRSFLHEGRAGAPEEGVTYGVASVFTEPALRGRGYAARMMSELGDALLARERWGVRLDKPGYPPSGTAHGVILFSDVGSELYARAGFAPRPAVDRVYLPEEGDPGDGVELLGEGDIAAALSSVPRPGGESSFVVWPTALQVDWHIERERVYASLLGGERPTAWGARLGGSLALWAGNFKLRELVILLLHAESPLQLEALVRSARRTARVAGLTRVTCWEVPTPFPWPEDLAGGQRRPRDGGLPMLRPLDPRVTPDNWAVIPRALWI